MNLVEYYGGTPFVRTLIEAFYQRILATPSLKTYFAHADISRLIQHQIRFFSAVMGDGPMYYSDAQLKRIHRPIGVTAKDFDTIIDILLQTLEEANLEEEHIREIGMAVIRKRKFIVA